MLPIINKLLIDPKYLVVTQEHCEPHAIIISPMRFLSLEIFREATKFPCGSILKTEVAYCGTFAYSHAQAVMNTYATDLVF
jgi:superfamily II DNA/RNA helicase